MFKAKKTYSIHFDEEKKVEAPSKHRGKKFLFKAFFNIGMGLVFAGYNVHLIKEKIENDIPIATSIEEDYKTVKDIISEPFLNVLKKAEGSSKKFYADNKGYATGYGVNFTQNDDAYNNEILTYAGVAPEIKKQIVEASRKYRNSTSKVIPPELKNIQFTQEQIDKMAFFAKKSYEHDFLTVLNEKLDNKHYNSKKKAKIINNYKDLYENQKAVLIHMAYKVGQNNLRKYNNFFELLISYLEDPTLENKDKVAKKFIYHYKDNGQDKLDNRVSVIHYDEFMKIPPVELTKNNKITTKPESSVPVVKLTDKEKWTKASKEVSEDLKLTNIFKKLKENATHNMNTKQNVPKENKNSRVDTMNDNDNIEELDPEEDYEEYEEYEIIQNGNVQLPKIKR